MGYLIVITLEGLEFWIRMGETGTWPDEHVAPIGRCNEFWTSEDFQIEEVKPAGSQIWLRYYRTVRSQ